MSSRLGIAGIVLLAAFGLAACGGGGGGTATAPEPEPTPSGPTPEERAEMVRTAATAAALDARDKGEAAGATATKALEDATKYTAMLDAVSSKGSSAKATMNAQMVLDAQEALTNAIAAAEMAVEAAEAAKEGADEETVASLESAIEAAEADIETAKAMVDAVDTEVAKVTGMKTDTGYPRAPAYHGTQVAKAIDTALASPTVSTSVPGTADMANGNQASTRMGYNWGQLIEKLGLPRRHTRVQKTGDSLGRVTESVVGAVVNGQAVPTLDENGVALTPAIAETLGDSPGVDVTMFGLPGKLYCQISTCTIKDGKLHGEPFEFTDPRTGEEFSLTPQWFFVPAATLTDRYVADSANPGMYMVETGFVRYGYWISQASASDPVVVNTYAVIDANGNTAGLDYTYPSTANEDEAATATYSGEALGVSSRQTGIEGGKPAYGSGEFTADVNLTARFGGSPTLEGTVGNFRGSEDAVDSRWSVTLMQHGLASTGALATSPVAKGDSDQTDGTWTAQAHGTAAKRPSGFFGTFNANFTNGSVAGGYATTRDTE